LGELAISRETGQTKLVSDISWGINLLKKTGEPIYFHPKDETSVDVLVPIPCPTAMTQIRTRWKPDFCIVEEGKSIWAINSLL